ncbi:MAG: AAA family ATPase [Flavobacteriales bacterium]|nr:AAA family ATPase [Flavobacteriales bacterium]
MIKKVHIRNFKTLKDLAFPCTRMNVFIGDTSTGKSNILEALTFFSRGALNGNKFDQRLIRYEKPEDLFAMHDLSEPVVVDIGALRMELGYSMGTFHLGFSELKRPGTKLKPLPGSTMDGFGNLPARSPLQFRTPVRRYEYVADAPFGPNMFKELEPPYGSNLPGLLAANKPLRTDINNLLAPTGMRLKVNLTDTTLMVVRTVDEDVEEQLPYRIVSDTLKRYLFLYTILATHKGYTLLLDEPEQNAFPFYVKHTGEMMGFDKDNQYFVTTHNPYLFRSIVEKTPMKELSVLITHIGPDGYTRLKRLTPTELGQLLDMDVFFNLDRFVKP